MLLVSSRILEKTLVNYKLLEKLNTMNDFDVVPFKKYGKQNVKNFLVFFKF